MSTTEIDDRQAAQVRDIENAGDVLERAEALAGFFESQAREAEDLGRLPERTVQAMKDAQIVRLLQPKRYGGHEAHPVDFAKAVIGIGARCGAAGWVAGVVGVHPHELALADPRVQEEIWGEDVNTWVASPYAPMGVAKPVDGGYVFNGHWKFSSGTDGCDWVVIGGFVAHPDGTPNREDIRHFILPRGDYEILQDSWQVSGLKGTGSKDLVVRDVFVPDHRVVPGMIEDLWGAARAVGLEAPVYAVPRAVMFAGTINTGTLALAQGALGAFIAYTRVRSNAAGPASQNMVQLQVLGEAAADIELSIEKQLTDFNRVYDHVATGRNAPLELVVEVRRNQVRNTHRALAAVDNLFLHAGGASLHLDQPLQRFWRDMHAAMNHMCNVAEPVYGNYSLNLFGHPVIGRV